VHAGSKRDSVCWRAATTTAASLAAASTGPARQPHIGPVTAMQRNATVSSALLTGGSDGRLRLWRLPGMHEVLLLEPFSVGVACAAWAPFKASVFAARLWPLKLLLHVGSPNRVVQHHGICLVLHILVPLAAGHRTCDL
jgi:hypothetical protein